MENSFLPRGIRNKNPLNLIRTKNNWQGKIPNPTDNKFEQFINIIMGLRAAIINIIYIVSKFKKCTVAQLINTWAPAQDNNNTTAYIDYVCKYAHLDKNDIIKFDTEIDQMKLAHIVKAMSIVENGGDFVENDDIKQAMKMAFQSRNISCLTT